MVPNMNSKMHVKKSDKVVVLSGVDKGKKGTVLFIDPKKRKVVVEGVKMVSKHKKPRKQGEPGGIIKQEAAINACKVMLICPKCGVPTRTGREILNDGSIVRVCKKCREQIDSK